MKKFLLFALTFFCIEGFIELGAQSDSSKKNLVAYFSESGNTRVVAQIIQSAVGADIFEIKTVKTYPKEYNPLITMAQKEQKENARPALSTNISNMDSYDIIFVGYPNWWGTMPMAIFTFLGQYNFAGKTVIPFCTHNGSRMGSSEGDIKKLIPKATVLGGLAIRGGRSGSFELGSPKERDTVQKEVGSWLRRLGMVN
ncbi:MAG: flavodoxin [Termitinemataceae bacterium]|nr:MAG: flavodoxin [Termitinemataceae bacterium]